MKSKRKKHKFLLVLFWLALITAAAYFCCWPVFTGGGHVEFVSRAAAYITPINRGDSVLAKAGGQTITARVTALPGDRVKASGGELYINGDKIGEYAMEDMDVLLEDGQYFALDSGGGGYELGKKNITAKVLFSW